MKTEATLFHFRGIPVTFHWSVIALGFFFFLIAIHFGDHIFIKYLSFISLITIHEMGHVFFAMKSKIRPHFIMVYPLWGFASLDMPSDYYKNLMISSGGLVFQAIILVPCLLWYHYLGDFGVRSINVFLMIFTSYNIYMIIFNLIPINFLGFQLDGFNIFMSIFKIIITSLQKAKSNKI